LIEKGTIKIKYDMIMIAKLKKKGIREKKINEKKENYNFSMY